MSDLIARLQDMVDFKHDDMDVAREAIEEITRLRAELATARREGMEEAAVLLEQIAVKEINGEYRSRLTRCLVTLSDGIAKIRADEKEGKP